MLLQRMIHAAFGQGAIRVLVNTNTTDMNLFTAAGSPTEAVRVVMTIAAGVIVGATSAVSYALNVGQFPAGSDITIDNYGQILGAGGAVNGGTGGGAINADYPNQTVVIRNHAGANIYAGGGGGGKGGTGGTGGTGGQGYYTVSESRYNGSNFWREAYSFGSLIATVARWDGVNRTPGPPFYRGAFVGSSDDGYGSSESSFYITYSANTYTSGGTGGAGGTGGNGGRGKGYDGNAVAGLSGAAGVVGANGGTNAGKGGSGGTGGAGGTGGDWGASGVAGSTGATGLMGANGNYTIGQSGTAGAVGAPGGLAGFYLKKGSASVTLINNGGVAGRLG